MERIEKLRTKGDRKSIGSVPEAPRAPRPAGGAWEGIIFFQRMMSVVGPARSN